MATNDKLPVTGANTYQSPERQPGFIARCWPSLAFYTKLLWIVYKAGSKANWDRYDGTAWALSSEEVLRLLERIGCRLDVSGLEHVRGVDGPCVFVGNHMSTLETFVLPCFIQPWRNVTFVVKQSLLKYPLFGEVLRSRKPIVVGRANPREDLGVVLGKGSEKLAEGTSIIVFPQSTRSPVFDPTHFNTIGVKLAKRAGVPVVPLALKTDAWSNGSRFKDFGPIHTERTVRFAFGEPLSISGQGKEEHHRICAFIADKMAEWGAAPDASAQSVQKQDS